ncbi:GlmU family protein [Robiginitalea marina]|uniref:GlmU family protein n=1 Tax=Robiginitalea marina TaxID=2954105 RepID=A0ABT1B085_9FLAO|nr:GlmU family protein [Robiginitalea marina]MCO5725317.1 GlmU family protein [Robiginitalea marina]
MHYILFDGDRREALLPLTYTRPVGALRTGILTLQEKWAHDLGAPVSFSTVAYLSGKFPMEAGTDNLFIKGSLLPDAHLVQAVQNLKKGEALFGPPGLLAYRSPEPLEEGQLEGLGRIAYPGDVLELRNTWDIFSINGPALEQDFERLTRGRESMPLPASNRAVHPEHIFLEEGASVEFSILNASEGPIYIGQGATVMEGSLIRGGFALGAHGVVKMGAKIYGPTTAGPWCKIGGEVNNAVLFGYSNKGHDGFLGNSVLGEWCNLGADTNNSNLKNNYARVRLWNYQSGGFDQTGLQFCGLVMGDHSKSAINTMFNTGTVVGVSCNIFAAGFPRNFIPSFSWGGTSGFSTYFPEKAFEAARVAMERRGQEFTREDEEIFLQVFEQSRKYRKS